MTFDKKDFLGFLIESKKATYASQGGDPSVTPLIDGSRQLEYRSGDFLYRDIYFGMSYFVGQETIYYKTHPVWSMSYGGGVDKKFDIKCVREIYSFLRKAMREITSNNPYRGPKKFIEGDLVYTDTNEGDIGWFRGDEKIIRSGEEVYSLSYSGGFLR
ncbi:MULTISPECIES: DUF5680 domain-containing protein [Alicyclobacillus]|uniref:DUF5680 domain-containing protein n=1 Tax=Alicyclobacillus acidoterrestris (strain ATCC 49025 / DSM 3922 / CIP 106132 / NCIMB 13137 / GD3B) TaxID=1356854 RepID=T0CT61_ALIAG|nr:MULTISPECIES: DUF5680 domain-containing protein [Alicyclobacillus]EPZ42582.1 hypothetical protein N007_14755 [Alicyclobacillus acidoterrestris ATCC 49025]UNO49100.1 DUF5680 domain-containing protein [Alicyclobacillus acidoterrestris]